MPQHYHDCASKPARSTTRSAARKQASKGAHNNTPEMSSSAPTTTQSKTWCWTLNSYVSTDLPAVVDACSWAIWSEEEGESGTPHLQGYLVLKNKTRLSGVKALFKDYTWVHIEAARGSHSQNKAYVTKDNNEFVYEYGVQPPDCPGDYGHLGGALGGQKERERWDTALTLAREGRIDEIDAQIQICQVRNLERIERRAVGSSMLSLTKPCGVFIWGPPGTGKSTKARSYGAFFAKEAGCKWWDTYSGEENIVIDDLSPSHVLTNKVMGANLKIWMDQYPFVAEFKGVASERIRPRRVIVTSNYSLQELFSDKLECRAIERRCQVLYMDQVYQAPPTSSSETFVQEPQGATQSASTAPTQLVQMETWDAQLPNLSQSGFDWDIENEEMEDVEMTQ